MRGARGRARFCAHARYLRSVSTVKMPRISLESRRWAITLYQNGYKLQEIRSRFEEEDIFISYKCLWELIKKYHGTQRIADMPRAARTKKLQQEHYVFIDNTMAENDELTARKLMEMLLTEFPNLDMSLSTVKRAKLDLGWVSTKPRYCQLIREANRSKRLTWCEERTAAGDTFDDVIWSDESRHKYAHTTKSKCPSFWNTSPLFPLPSHLPFLPTPYPTYLYTVLIYCSVSPSLYFAGCPPCFISFDVG